MYSYKRHPISISFTLIILIQNNQISMQKPPIFIYTNQMQKDLAEIQDKLMQVKKDLNQLIHGKGPNEMMQPFYRFGNFIELQNMILRASKIWNQPINRYKADCSQIAHLYAQYLLNPLPTTFIPQLESTKLFDFKRCYYQACYKRIKHKLSRQSAENFIDASKEGSVIDTCVGCNKWFYKYHPIESEYTPKSIPIYFIYNKNHQYDKLIKNNLIRAPSPFLLIDIKEQPSSKEILLRQILWILNNKGGFLLVGCQRISLINKIKLLPQGALDLHKSLSDIHFVIGQLVTKEFKKQLQNLIKSVTQSISPLVTLGQQVEIKYLPVFHSKYNQGEGLNHIYKPDIEDRVVILIAIKPKPKTYYQRTKNQQVYSQSQPFSSTNSPLQPHQVGRNQHGLYAQEPHPLTAEQFEHGYPKKPELNQSSPSEHRQILNPTGMRIQQLLLKQGVVFDTHKCLYDQK